MRKYLLLIFSLCILPLSAQNSAEKLLQKTVSKIQKDGGITMTMDAEVKYEHGTDRIDLVLKMSGNSFYAQEDENLMWFDGKTLWRGNDFGDGIEEIYITEPTPEEKARYDIVNLLGKHQGFSVSGNGTDTFTLTASNAERSVEGIRSVTVQVDPDTYVFRNLSVSFAEELGNISARVRVTDYKAGQKFDKSTFTCPVSDYKDAEIIDLR
jgi:outer membrane lipoprotein-sorting protein